MMYREVIELNDQDDDGSQSPKWARWRAVELIMEGVSLVGLIACFFMLIFYWGKVDDEIPVYFIYGVAMAWFSKAYLLIIPFLSLVLWLIMSLYAYVVQKNISDKLKTQKFGRMQYLVDRFYLGLVKMEIISIFFLVERRVILLALGRTTRSYELPLFAVALIVTLFRYMSKRSKIT
jgi:hypothetical protein